MEYSDTCGLQHEQACSDPRQVCLACTLAAGWHIAKQDEIMMHAMPCTWINHVPVVHMLCDLKYLLPELCACGSAIIFKPKCSLLV